MAKAKEAPRQSSGGLTVVALVLLAVLWLGYAKNDAPAPAPGPVVVVPEACRPAIESIRRIPIEPADARHLAAFYEAFAATVERDAAGENLLDTSETIRISNGRCGKLCLSDKGVHGKYPGLSDLVDETIALSIGSGKQANGEFEPVTLDARKKQQLAQAIRGVARAVWE